MIHNDAPYRVLLPKWVFKTQDKGHFKKLLAEYMRFYPNYTVKAIKNGFAVCERRD